jgi:endonuclease/exonuclease/phosphatase family metal-dependent hydrolase
MLSIVTYNIQWGKGRDQAIDLDRIARTVAEADIICLQEVERNWRDQPYPDQALRLADLLPQREWVYGPSLDLGGGVGKPRRQCGNMILSRYPISSTRNLPLPARAVHGHMNDQQAMIEAVIEAGNGGVRIYNVHLNYLSQRQRREQVALIKNFIARAPLDGGPVTSPGKTSSGPEDDWIVLPNGKLPLMPASAILLGDFNAGTQSPEYQDIAGETGPIHGRLTEAGAFADALTVSGLDEAEGVTFPGGGTERPQRLDHCFVSMDLVDAVKSAWIDDSAMGSDHQPVWVQLDFQKQARAAFP